MRINHNIAALNTHRQLAGNTGNTAKSLEKLSSGLRVNRAGDDAAGLAISEKMRSQIRGLDQASRNAQDGISFIQTAEGALNETHSILQRMRELAVQSATDTNTDADRLEIQKEVNQLLEEVNRIADTTQFNGMEILNGRFDGENIDASATANGGAGTFGMVFHIGSNASQTASLKINKMDISKLGTIEGGTTALGEIATATIASKSASGDMAAGTTNSDLTTREGANKALEIIDAAIKDVSAERAKLGAMQNRLDHTINNLGTTSENLSASESRIRDVDMAKEMMEFTKNNILSQASQAMLAQANMQPQSVLQLLQ